MDPGNPIEKDCHQKVVKYFHSVTVNIASIGIPLQASGKTSQLGKSIDYLSPLVACIGTSEPLKLELIQISLRNRF